MSKIYLVEFSHDYEGTVTVGMFTKLEEANAVYERVVYGDDKFLSSVELDTFAGGWLDGEQDGESERIDDNIIRTARRQDAGEYWLEDDSYGWCDCCGTQTCQENN